MMLEDELFQKWKKKDAALIEYGFIQQAEEYVLEQKLMDSFSVRIVVEPDSRVRGKVIDQCLQEEYINFRIESQNGSFVSLVREAYTLLLEDIRCHCFEKEWFVSAQANRIACKILYQYGVTPAFLWKKDEDTGVFRHLDTLKWFGIIQYVPLNRILGDGQGKVNLLNLKLDALCAKRILEPGYYPAYHMNKKNWVSISLDDTVDDEKILQDVACSYQNTSPNKRK